MQKIPTLFERDWEGNRSRVLPVVNPAAQWLVDEPSMCSRVHGESCLYGSGSARATRKRDGTAVLVRGGTLWKRLMVHKDKPAPAGFLPAQEAVDPETGQWPGWVPVGEGPEDIWHRIARMPKDAEALVEGATYELCGPKIQGNPEGFEAHVLIRHGVELIEGLAGLEYEQVKAYLEAVPIEGIVWWGSDARMVKIKARDFGIGWPRR